MIGFEDVPVSDRTHPNESSETKSLDKRAFYNLLTKTYCLPPFASRGISRDYLFRVHKGEFLRVKTNDLRHFEVELTPEMNKRVGLQNNYFLVRKFKVYLQIHKCPELGFDEYDPPEEAWLYRIIRYVDPTNMMELFEAAVRAEPPYIHGTHNLIQAVHHGRIIASKYFFRLDTIKKDRKMWENLKQLSNNYRAYLCQRMLIDKMEHDLKTAREKSAEYLRQMQDQISKIAFTYSMVENPAIRADMIISGSKDLTDKMRKDIDFNCQL